VPATAGKRRPYANVSRIIAWLRAEPAVIAYAVNVGIAALAAYGLHLTRTQTAATTTIATAVLAIAAAALTRPVPVSAITGAAATIATAAAAFGSHLTSSQIGTGVTLLSLVLSLLIRQNVSPTPAAIRLAVNHGIRQPLTMAPTLHQAA
jgi:hypothetical protein